MLQAGSLFLSLFFQQSRSAFSVIQTFVNLAPSLWATEKVFFLWNGARWRELCLLVDSKSQEQMFDLKITLNDHSCRGRCCRGDAGVIWRAGWTGRIEYCTCSMFKFITAFSGEHNHLFLYARVDGYVP